MHDPSTLLFDVRPIRLDIWHDEPGGHDAGTVCGNPPMTTLGALLWGIRHVRHLHYRFWPSVVRIRHRLGIEAGVPLGSNPIYPASDIPTRPRKAG